MWSILRPAAAVGGILILFAAVVHERVAENCLEHGGRWHMARLACASPTRTDMLGLALRRTIDAAFARQRAKPGSGVGTRQTISALVAAVIPPGTEVTQAAALLRAAGFHVGPAAPCAPGRGTMHCLAAHIDDYAFTLFGSTSVQVVVEAGGPAGLVRALAADIVTERAL
jgi:hypothetical protein